MNGPIKRLLPLLCWLLPLGAGADAGRPVPPVPDYPLADPPLSATNLWFDVGEELLYDIHWGIINVGSSRVTTDWITYDDGRVLLRIRFASRSNKVLATLYPVEDLQEVLIDPETFLPVVHVMKSRQGKRHVYERTRFDHAAGKAYWDSFLKGKSKVLDIDPDTRDLITLMYFVRSMDYQVGDEMNTRVYTDEKIFDLQIKIPKKEVVQLSRYGRVGSLMFEPEAKFQGLFVRKGKGYLWVSDDHRRLCTKIAAQIPVASIRIQLVEVRGPGHDFWVGKSTPGAAETMPMKRSSVKK